MPCYRPLTAYYSKEVGSSGKRGITFIRSASFSGIPLMLPCGQCVGCRLERSRQWAIRCMHEKSLHDESVFITLTYDEENLPKDMSLSVRDLQLFNKKLGKVVRKSRGKGFRFYACGEYGEMTGRPHYHMILYGYDFLDKKFYKNAKRGERLYNSKSLDEIWGLGYCVLGDVTFDSAAYVARYIMKKVTGDAASDHYSWIDDDGCIHSRKPEFTVMSRRPGIGAAWFDKFQREAYLSDSVIMNGREIRPPRFYDSKYELVDNVRLEMLKKRRRRAAWKHRKDNSRERLRVREIVAIKKLLMKGREL